MVLSWLPPFLFLVDQYSAHRRLSLIFRAGLEFRLSRNSFMHASTFLSVVMVKLFNQKQLGGGKG